MRYFDKSLVANSKLHKQWWGEVTADRAHFHNTEEAMARISNEAAILPQDAWRDLDAVTKTIMRNDEGQAYMADLMPLAKAVDIGKLVHLTRQASDAGTVKRSMSGQVPIDMDKVVYNYRGTPVPIFDSGYGREWREWNTLRSENFDALMDDQEAHTAAVRQDMAQFVLNGDSNIVVQGYEAYGIKNNPLTKQIDLGSGGANIDLTASATTSDAIDNFFTQVVGKVLDDNNVGLGVNVYVSPEIGRRLDLSYSGSSGFKGGSLRDYLLTNRRINKIEVTFEMTGNEWIAFPPSAEYIRPLIGMAVSTIAIPRIMPRANYQFMVSGAMGLEIRADYDGRTGVLYASEIT